MNTRGRITAEIAPYLLYQKSDKIADGQTCWKSLPPIKKEEERQLLILSWQKKYFDIVSSNHFPVHPKYKQEVDGDLLRALPGISCISLTLPLMWSLYRQDDNLFQDPKRNRRYNEDAYLRKLVSHCCEKPAQLLGLGKVKGVIEQGFRADFVVFNPDVEKVVGAADNLSKYP